MLSDESQVWLMENHSHFATDDTAPSAAVTPVSSAVNEPQTTSATLNSSSSAECRPCWSQTNPFQIPSAAEDVSVQCSYHSTSPTTSQSDVDVSSRPLSPDSAADYSVAAENVADTSDEYQQCGVHVKPISTVHFDSPPVALNSNIDELCSEKYSTASFHDSGVSGRSNENQEVPSNLFSLPSKNDPYCSVAGLNSSENLSLKFSDLPSSYVTSAAVTASSGSSDKDAADVCSYSSQLQTLDVTGTKGATGRYPCPKSCGNELPNSDEYSPTTEAGQYSSSSDPAYALASVSVRLSPTALYGPPAPLPPVSHNIA